MSITIGNTLIIVAFVSMLSVIGMYFFFLYQALALEKSAQAFEKERHEMSNVMVTSLDTPIEEIVGNQVTDVAYVVTASAETVVASFADR